MVRRRTRCRQDRVILIAALVARLAGRLDLHSLWDVLRFLQLVTICNRVIIPNLRACVGRGFYHGRCYRGFWHGLGLFHRVNVVKGSYPRGHSARGGTNLRILASPLYLDDVPLRAIG